MALVEAEAFAVTKELMETHLAIFQQRGFLLLERIFGKNSAGWPKLTFRFIEERANLRLRVLFSISAPQTKGIFVVRIDNSRKETLDVEDYLRLHGDAAEASLFVCTKDVPDFTKYVESFLSMLDRVFENQLKPILSGDKWESTPIDWQGYK